MLDGKIGNTQVHIVAGDITALEVGAYVIPQFASCASFGGVGGAVARSGGEEGLNKFQGFVDAYGEQPFSSVLLTESGGGNSNSHLHAVTVGSGREEEYLVIHNALLNVLAAAGESNIESIAVPALGTGIIGQLTKEQSAKSMMSAIMKYTTQNANIRHIYFVIYARSEQDDAFQAFANVLQSRSYENAEPEDGNAEFSWKRWNEGMSKDIKANKQAFG